MAAELVEEDLRWQRRPVLLAVAAATVTSFALALWSESLFLVVAYALPFLVAIPLLARTGHHLHTASLSVGLGIVGLGVLLFWILYPLLPYVPVGLALISAAAARGRARRVFGLISVVIGAAALLMGIALAILILANLHR